MKKQLSLLMALALLSGCSSGPAKSPYDPYANREGESANTYNGNGEDFHLNNWYASDFGQIESPKEQDDGSLLISYTKQVDYEYTNLYTTVIGPLADFTYINFYAKGTPGKGIAFRMYYGESDDEFHNVLGNDVSFSLTDEYKIHTLKVKGTLQSRMDLLSKVCIFPEMGLAGGSGEFFIKDVYFSKALPEGAIWENTGVDTGDTGVTVNGWKTQAWTMYTMYDLGNGKTGVAYSKAAEWGFIEKAIEIPEGNNHLRFSFENCLSSGKPSITCMRMVLRGDVSAHISEGVEYEYDVYYEGTIYNYDLTNEKEVQPDENGVTTIDADMSSALDTIGSHHEGGYRLVLLIESVPEEVSKFKRYRDGEMNIISVETFKGEAKVDPYSQYGNTTYTLTDKDGVDKNVAYTNVSGSSYWPRLCRKVEASHDSQITIKFHNNGEDSVMLGLHAGIFSDDRSDGKNNMFYPLWYANNGAKNTDGYYTDGQTLTLEGNGDLSVTMSVDEGYAETDAIDVIEILIDNCCGDSKLRSGNIDIVSVTVE